MPIYSLYGTLLQLEMSETAAIAYNRAMDAFKIMPPEVDRKDLQIHVDPEALFAWNAIADIINALIELNDGGITHYSKLIEDPFKIDYLVKV